ncbi:MAG: MerR family transcriptional regulator [Actinomycetota bacterium]
MGDRAYLSIGEVLSLLKDEFPDVTISKIRFLESQGLLDPERTASGYRKFYDPDVERLRWILRQQREHFLPLKVIKGRLVGEDPEMDDPPATGSTSAEHPSQSPSPPPGPVAVPPLPAQPAPAPAPPVEAVTARPRPPDPTAAPAAPPRGDAADLPGPLPAPPRPVPAPPDRPRDTMLSAGLTGASLTMEELSGACGLPYDRLRELERYGFITGRQVAGTVYYDEESLVVANLAAGFARFGIEGRHLRIYKNSAEREAGLFEQIVTPLLKQRNPEARRQAVQALEDLTHLGQSLRAAVLRQAIRRLSGG